MNIEKVKPTESETSTQTIYTVTAIFNFTDEDLTDPEVKAFYDVLQPPVEDVTTEEQY